MEQRFPSLAYLRALYQSVNEYLQIPISAQPDTYFDFELADFCKKFKLDAVTASHGLKLLEQEGLWTLTEAVFRPATVMFTATRQELDEIASMYPRLALVTISLLRLYSSVLHYPTPFRLSVVAGQVKLRQDETETLLLQLQKMGVLEYYKPKEGPQLFFHHYRVDSRHLLIDMNRITRLKQHAEAKTLAMIAWLENTQHCRNALLLQYFGENTTQQCGHCDVCQSKTARRTNMHGIRQEILHCIGQQPVPVHLRQVSETFPPAIREEISALIRDMVDEGMIKLHENGAVSLVK